MTAALLLALAAAASPAATEQLRKAPVRVDADEVQYAFQKKEVTFSGKRPVVLTRADATLICKRIVAKTGEAGQITSAACNGDVRFTRGVRTVTCNQANFDDVAERVVCEGNVVLKDAGTEARGTRLVYDLRADNVMLEGNTTVTLPGAEIDQRQKEFEEQRQQKKEEQRQQKKKEAGK